MEGLIFGILRYLKSSDCNDRQKLKDLYQCTLSVRANKIFQTLTVFVFTES